MRILTENDLKKIGAGYHDKVILRLQLEAPTQYAYILAAVLHGLVDKSISLADIVEYHQEHPEVFENLNLTQVHTVLGHC